MSSDYRLLCLSHDPALCVGPDYEWNNQPDTALAAAADPVRRREYGHPNCDLVVGAFSYPLVEVGCPALPLSPTELRHTEGDRVLHGGWHRQPTWTDAFWLRLLALADRIAPWPPLQEVLGRQRPLCWPPQRLARLAQLLDVPDAPAGILVSPPLSDEEAAEMRRRFEGPR